MSTSCRVWDRTFFGIIFDSILGTKCMTGFETAMIIWIIIANGSFVRPNEAVYAIIGGQAKIPCHGLYPGAKASWLHRPNNSTAWIRSRTQYYVSEDTDRGGLTINVPSVSLDGLSFRCEYGNVKRDTRLQVFALPKRVEITKVFQYLNEHVRSEFICSANGYFPSLYGNASAILWFMDKVRIRENGENAKQVDEVFSPAQHRFTATSRLQIKTTRADDGKVLECRYTFQVGRDLTSNYIHMQTSDFITLESKKKQPTSSLFDYFNIGKVKGHFVVMLLCLSVVLLPCLVCLTHRFLHSSHKRPLTLTRVNKKSAKFIRNNELTKFLVRSKKQMVGKQPFIDIRLKA